MSSLRSHVALLLALPTAAAAQPPDPKFAYAKPEEVKAVEWQASAKAGLVHVTGNARTTTATMSAAVSRRTTWNKLSLEGGLAYARSSVLAAEDLNANGAIDEGEIRRDRQTAANNWSVKGRYDRFFTSNNSGYVAALASADRPAGKELVGGGQIGYSRQLYKSKSREAVAEVGYDFSYENYLDPAEGAPGSVSIHSARVFLGGTLTPHDAAVLTASFEALLNLDEEQAPNAATGSDHVPAFEDTRLVAKAGITTKLWKSVSFGVGFALRYDNNPAPRPKLKGADYAAGFVPFSDKLDTTTEAALIVTFL